MDQGQTEQNPKGKISRGKGRGGRFFALSKGTWDNLWQIETSNRLNLVTAFLVLLAGTGADHRLTKWSAKACEEYVGMGKPRAKRAIDELIAAGLVERTESSTAMRPQYLMPDLPRDIEPIFLPVQLVTGLSNEAPMLRRVRETGDALLLRMLIDIYGLIEPDLTYGVPIANLREAGTEDIDARKVLEMGANSVWALVYGGRTMAAGEWTTRHYDSECSAGEEWNPFWERIRKLRSIGALYFEPWVFEGPSLDAEPLFPIVIQDRISQREEDPVTKITSQAYSTSMALAGERTWLIESHSADALVPMALHQQQPALQGVARLKVEPDTPGHRRAYAKRMESIERYIAAFARVEAGAIEGRFDYPVSAMLSTGLS